MYKISFFILLLITYCLNIVMSSQAYANQDTGCLFCHQYPGLVRLEQNKQIKILHIDPELYSKTSHGQLGCTDCHKGINKIPHTGAVTIDCTSKCHQPIEEQELIKQISLNNFHKNQQSIITQLPDQTSCKICHSIYPHSKQPFTRVWLNMHTNYLICETCHLKKDKYPKLTYQWITTKGVEFGGRAFGAYFDPDKKHTQSPENSLSRIIPVIKSNGVIYPIINIDDTEKAKAFLASGPASTKENMATAMNYYHRDIEKMNLTTVCETCHAKNGLLDFNALGFTKERADVLINTNINSIVSDYKNFYIPHIFE
ncbi:MAG: cytochrome c3 family protein [Gammaproteobacteria bacterium]|nr:cytochrome c3 family protein [Gammaproteobacteria bacterium]